MVTKGHNCTSEVTLREMPLVNSDVAYGQYVKLFKCTATYAFNTFGSKVIKTVSFWPKCKNLHTTNVANRKLQNPLQR